MLITHLPKEKPLKRARIHVHWRRRWSYQWLSRGEGLPFRDIPFPAFVFALGLYEMALSYILVSEYYVAVIYEAAVVLFSLAFLYKIVKAARTLVRD